MHSLSELASQIRSQGYHAVTKKIELSPEPSDPGGQPPCRSHQPLELGFFAWNVKGGMTASTAVLENPERYQDYWKWPQASRLIKLAEDVGFDYEVPFSRWIGHGGETQYNDSSLDGLTSAAALASITRDILLFSTVHVTYKFHPLHFAKFGATVDHISGGRWALNIVSGYSYREMAAFGISPKIPHDLAYEMADEFTTLLKYLWAGDEPIEFIGKYYTVLGAIVSPKAIRRPRPILMSAGNSEVGLDFACRQADWAFITAPTLEAYKTRVEEVHRKAAKYKREVHAATMVYVIMDSTDARANATAEHVAENVDRTATRNFIDTLKAISYGEEFLSPRGDEHDPWYGVGKDQFLHIAMGIGAWWLIGSYETVAQQLRALHDIGIESVLVSFFDPLRGLHQTEDDLLPLLKKMNLRR
jgi:FMNH2-dependent dimethyl sulfone monooxygenase